MPLTADSLIEKYADDPFKARVLLRLYGASEAPTLSDLAASLRFHTTKTRKLLDVLVADKLVVREGAGRSARYSLSLKPATRSLVTEFLRRTLDGPPGRGRTH